MSGGLAATSVQCGQHSVESVLRCQGRSHKPTSEEEAAYNLLTGHYAGAVGGWGGGRRDSAASRRSSRSSFGGTDTTGHLLDMDVDEPLEPLDFQVLHPKS